MEILRGKFMKHEYRKHEKGLYLPKTKPELITVPKQKFIMIDKAILIAIALQKRLVHCIL